MLSEAQRQRELERLSEQGVDLDLAIRCAEVARLAYAAPEDGRQRARQYGYNAYHAMQRRHGRDHLIVVSQPHRHLVAIRGTDHVSDWLTNLRLWGRWTPMGLVHAGYFGVLESFYEELTAYLESVPPLPLILAGHSMGGAIALLAALKLQNDGFPVQGLYTFGQPKTGTLGFSNYVRTHYQQPYLRFVHGADALATWGFGRSLLGKPVYFDIRGRMGFGRQWRQLPYLGVRFHRLEHYRYFLRLTKLRLQPVDADADITQIQDV